MTPSQITITHITIWNSIITLHPSKKLNIYLEKILQTETRLKLRRVMNKGTTVIWPNILLKFIRWTV